METLQEALYLEKVPPSWKDRAYPSLLGLGPWFSDLLVRIRVLANWTSDFQLPTSVWIGGLFNPQSFLTAIMQTTARKSELPLDKMVLTIDETKRIEDVSTFGYPKNGIFCNGFYMEGARWDSHTNQIVESKIKELSQQMPHWHIKAITIEQRNENRNSNNFNFYECPVYKTRQRGQTYVWTFNLKTKENPSNWILGGVCLLLQI